MSPEQATGGEVDFRSDQFSFGSVLYEMVTGSPAFQKKTYAETTAAILRDEPERLGARMLQAPAPFIWIVERCLAKDPKQRYASTRDLARDLAAVRDRLADAPARESEPRPNNLPVQRTAFIGREHEAAGLRQLLSRADVQLVTLTGPGGIGKTRLALQVAGEIADQFPGGVCFVALSAIGEPGLIASAIAQAVGVRETGNQSPQESLKEYLGGLTSRCFSCSTTSSTSSPPRRSWRSCSLPARNSRSWSQARRRFMSMANMNSPCHRSRCPTPSPFRLWKCFPVFQRSRCLWNARRL